MPNVVTGRSGGNALLAGGVLWVIAIVLHPVVPDMDAMATASGLAWIVDHWAYLIGDLLLIAGLLLFFRHLEQRGAEGWGALALAAGVLAFTLDAASTGMHLVAFPAATAAADQPGYAALVWVQGSIGTSGGYFFAITIILLGAALLRAGGWRILAYAGIGLGVVELVLMLGNAYPASIAGSLIWALAPLWVAVLGLKVAGTRAREGAPAAV